MDTLNLLRVSQTESSESNQSFHDNSKEPSIASQNSSQSSPLIMVIENYGEFTYYGSISITKTASMVKLCQILFDCALANFKDSTMASHISLEITCNDQVCDVNKSVMKIGTEVIQAKNIELIIRKESFYAFISLNTTSFDDTYECFMLWVDDYDKVNAVISRILELNENGGKKSFGNNVELDLDFEVQIKEKDDKSSYNSCPVVANTKTFKVRRNKSKLFIFSFIPSIKRFRIGKCDFAAFSLGTAFSHGQMENLDIKYSIYERNGRVNFFFESPAEKIDLFLGDHSNVTVPMLIKTDLSILGLKNPAKTTFEFFVRIFPPNEKFLLFRTKSVREKYKATLLRDYESKPANCVSYVIGEMMYHTINKHSAFSLFRGVEESPGLDFDGVMSGSGAVERQITNEDLFLRWERLLPRLKGDWPIPEGLRRDLRQLCWQGVPDTMRCLVWQKLVGCDNENVLTDVYRHLTSKTSPYESVILRDIGRTYPGHKMFAESCDGQISLLKVTKAYSIYDEEVGYCQGTSFIAAALLLHMPEEQAFVVFANIMRRLNFRDLLVNEFKGLELLQWQFGRLLQDKLPELWGHFKAIGLDTSMYTSQWFLTLFTAKFPLNMVFRIIDVILCNGIDYLLNISLALLHQSQDVLVKLDFERVFNFFRLDMAKQFGNDSVCTTLMALAEEIKITKKTLSRLKVEYETVKSVQGQLDPFHRYKKEIGDLRRENMRLECECELITSELLNYQLKFRTETDKLEEEVHRLSRSNNSLKESAGAMEGEKRLVEEEFRELKDGYRTQLSKYERREWEMNALVEKFRGELEAQSGLREFVEKCPECGERLKEVGGSGQVARMCEEINGLEIKLADTKLALVESRCLNESLEHQLQSLMIETRKSEMRNRK